MAGPVANYADGVTQALVGKLGQLLSEEYRLLSRVRVEVGHLRDDVSVMNALLRMLSEADDGAVDHFVREWMKQVRELAYDAEDCIDIFVLRISCVPRSPRMFGGARLLIVTLRARHRLAADIQVLRARAVAIGERRVRYGIDGQALQPSVSFGATPSSALVVRASTGNYPSQFVGINDQVDSLSEKVKSVEVMSDNHPDRRVKVFSIVGFGGLGKTTLAEEVCRKLKEEFTCQAIVSVSQAFHATKDMDGLLSRIHQHVMKEKRGLQEEIAPTTTLNELLLEKRYLIVMDDVWTISDWDAIRSELPENNNSSRIIVTTRIESVAKTCSPTSAWGHYIHQVKPLKPEDSKRLFIDRVYGTAQGQKNQLPTRMAGVELAITEPRTLYHSVSGALSKRFPWVFGITPTTEALIAQDPSQATICPEELREAMDEILRKCGGLPLAIVSIGSLLANYKH